MKIASLYIADTEFEFTHIRSPGPGGQNVNKVATGIQLRFNIENSNLPEEIKTRLLNQNRITQHKELIIKATRFRTQERNKQDALERLENLIRNASIRPKKRRKTKPTKGAKEKRLKHKKKHSLTKQLRQKHF